MEAVQHRTSLEVHISQSWGPKVHSRLICKAGKGIVDHGDFHKKKVFRTACTNLLVYLWFSSSSHNFFIVEFEFLTFLGQSLYYKTGSFKYIAMY